MGSGTETVLQHEARNELSLSQLWLLSSRNGPCSTRDFIFTGWQFTLSEFLIEAVFYLLLGTMKFNPSPNIFSYLQLFLPPSSQFTRTTFSFSYHC